MSDTSDTRNSEFSRLRTHSACNNLQPRRRGSTCVSPPESDEYMSVTRMSVKPRRVKSNDVSQSAGPREFAVSIIHSEPTPTPISSTSSSPYRQLHRRRSLAGPFASRASSTRSGPSRFESEESDDRRRVFRKLSLLAFTESSLRLVKHGTSSGVFVPYKKGLQVSIWPEWNEADVATEKWDGIQKHKDRVRSPAIANAFDDPEGKPHLPFAVDHWKRPVEAIDATDHQKLCIFDQENCFSIDLISSSERAHHSELMRWMSSQIMSLFNIQNSNSLSCGDDSSLPHPFWSPWSCIYAINKPSKAPNLPAYNPFGKYIVKLFWLGSWRKLIVDDSMPYDSQGCLLFPSSPNKCELWPMILCKALCKIAAVDHFRARDDREFADFDLIQCLTGWLPEIIPLSNEKTDVIWMLLNNSIKKYQQLPHPSAQEAVAQNEDAEADALIQEKLDKRGKPSKKDKQKDKAVASSDGAGVDRSSIVALVSYCGLPKHPVSISRMAQTASASERLRQLGIPPLLSHPLHIIQTRDCDLEAPPPEEPIPAWKLIRPKKSKVFPSDEPQEVEKEKPIRLLQLSSPFMNKCPADDPCHRDFSRVNSALSRGGTRPSTATHCVNAIEEEENEDQKGLQNLDKQEASELPPDPSPLPADSVENSVVAESVTAATVPNDTPGSRSKMQSSSRSRKNSKSAAKVLKASVSSGTPIPKPEEDIPKKPVQELVKLWVDVGEVCGSLGQLHLYHKMASYKHSAQHSNMKSISPSVFKDRKQNAAVSEEKSPQYLFVDSLQPIEIIINFSALSQWTDCLASKSRDRSESRMMGNGEFTETTSTIGREEPGHFRLERFIWSDLKRSSPLLQIKTCGSQSAALILLPGRHLLSASLRAPLAFHANLCSNTPFTFGTEDTIVQQVSKESLRFRKVAHDIFFAMGTALQCFEDADKFAGSYQQLLREHCPFIKDTSTPKRNHFQNFNGAVYETLCKPLQEAGLLSSQVALAWRAFLFDPITPSVFKASSTPSSRSEMGSGFVREASRLSARKSQRKKTEKVERQKENAVTSEPEREASSDETRAATKLQSSWRAAWTRKILKARVQGSPENCSARQLLLRSWQVLQPKSQEHSTNLLKNFLRRSPASMPLYGLGEWDQVVVKDYEGKHGELPARTSAVVMRERFYVNSLPVLCSLRAQASALPIILRVVDNDNYQEIPRLILQVAPHLFKKNKNGYSVVAEAKTVDSVVPRGDCLLRLIGRFHPLPAPSSPDVCCSFLSEHIQDYYCPDTDVFLRYTIESSCEQVLSIRLTTSNPSVVVELSIENFGKPEVCTTGQGSAFVPAFIVRKSSSNLQSEATRSKTSLQKSKKETLKERKSSPDMRDLDPGEPTKYVIIARVMKQSWKLNDDEQKFVAALQNEEKKEMNVGYCSGERQSLGAQKIRERKSLKNITLTSSLDLSQPHWKLQVICDAKSMENLSLQRDTERFAAIREAKKGWELSDPGRAEKARRAREKFLAEHSIIEKDENGQEIRKINKVDISPYIEDPIAGEVFVEKIMQENHRRIVEFEGSRRQAEEETMQELNRLNTLKVEQVRVFQDLQNRVESSRLEIRELYGEIRQKMIEKKLQKKQDDEEIEQIDHKKQALAGARRKKSPQQKRKKEK